MTVFYAAVHKDQTLAWIISEKPCSLQLDIKKSETQDIIYKIMTLMCSYINEKSVVCLRYRKDIEYATTGTVGTNFVLKSDDIYLKFVINGDQSEIMIPNDYVTHHGCYRKFIEAVDDPPTIKQESI